MDRARKPSPLELERWLSGELDPALRARFEQRWPREVLDAARDADRALRAQLLGELPAERFAAGVHERVRRSRRARGAFLWLPALSAVALAALLLGRPAPGAAPNEPPTGERAKGFAPRLFVHRQRAGGDELLRDGSVCRPGDLLQLGYAGAAHRYGAIVSLDGAGNVTLHFPAGAEAPSALPTGGGEHLLPSSFELDAAPGFERFVFVSAERAIDVDAVLSAARRLAADADRAHVAPLALPLDYRQTTLLLRKER
jgi:hypothetical protein